MSPAPAWAIQSTDFPGTTLRGRCCSVSPGLQLGHGAGAVPKREAAPPSIGQHPGTRSDRYLVSLPPPAAPRLLLARVCSERRHPARLCERPSRFVALLPSQSGEIHPTRELRLPQIPEAQALPSATTFTPCKSLPKAIYDGCGVQRLVPVTAASSAEGAVSPMEPQPNFGLIPYSLPFL